MTNNMKALALLIGMGAAALFFMSPSVHGSSHDGAKQLTVVNNTSGTMHFGFTKNPSRGVMEVFSVNSNESTQVAHPAHRRGTMTMYFASKPSMLKGRIGSNVSNASISGAQSKVTMSTPCCGPLRPAIAR